MMVAAYFDTCLDAILKHEHRGISIRFGTFATKSAHHCPKLPSTDVRMLSQNFNDERSATITFAARVVDVDQTEATWTRCFRHNGYIAR